MRALSTLLFASVMAFAPATLGAQDQRLHPTVMVSIEGFSPAIEQRVRRALPHLDVITRRQPNQVEALVHDRDLETLRALGTEPVVLHDDVEAYWASQLAPPGTVPAHRGGFARGSMGGFLTLAEIVALLDTWRQQYPNLITVRRSIGQSIEGREQWLVKISANADIDEDEPEIYMETLIHAREASAMMATMRCMEYLLSRYGTDPVITDLLDNREIWYVPVMNADGYEYNRQIAPNGGGSWRKNRRLVTGTTYGIDLNRNFGYQWGFDNTGSSPTPSSGTYRGASAFSEPEAANVRDFITSRLGLGLTTAWDIHNSGGLCMWPWGYANAQSSRHAHYAEMAGDLVAQHGYRPGIVNTTLYPINGGGVDWFEGTANLYGWLPELGEAFWVSNDRILALAEENLHMLLTAVKYAGPYLVTEQLAVIEIGDGDGAFEPGERIEVAATVRNRGVVTATATTLLLTSVTPFAQIEIGSVALGNVASFTSASHAATPLRAAIPEWVAPGTRLALRLHHRFAGHQLAQAIEVIVGVPQVLVSDDCETPAWTMGVVGDDATAGRWTHGNPNVTYSLSPFVVQTGDDHTPGSGANCYVTGNAATTSASADDVDGGRTTLVTPLYDLAQARNPYIELWRWFMDHGREPNNDALAISVTNDAGQTWHDVDTVTASEPAWRRLSFRLRDYVVPTARVQVRVVATDRPDDSDCEALVDDLKITDYDDGVRIVLSGSTQIGQTALLDLQAPRSSQRAYFAAVAFGGTPGFVLPSGRVIPLAPDPLFQTFLSAPAMFQNFVGQLDGSGRTTARIVIPALTFLRGITIHAAFVTLQPGAPDGIRDISAGVPITFQ